MYASYECVHNDGLGKIKTPFQTTTKKKNIYPQWQPLNNNNLLPRTHVLSVYIFLCVSVMGVPFDTQNLYIILKDDVSPTCIYVSRYI